MTHYVFNFAIYTMAMIGLICFALFAYKKFSIAGFSKNDTHFLKIEDALSLSPRKRLFVIKAGNEKFLISADIDRTTFLAKLDSNSINSEVAELDEIDKANLEEQKITY